jgi:hypothetical protein
MGSQVSTVANSLVDRWRAAPIPPGTPESQAAAFASVSNTVAALLEPEGNAAKLGKMSLTSPEVAARTLIGLPFTWWNTSPREAAVRGLATSVASRLLGVPAGVSAGLEQAQSALAKIPLEARFITSCHPPL